MALQEKHKYNALTWHFRKNSGLRETVAGVADGFVAGATWGRGEGLHIAGTIAAFGTLFGVAGGVITDGISYDLLTDRYDDPTITSHLTGDSALSYSALINPESQTPVILVRDGEGVRLYETEKHRSSLEWDLVTSQTTALQVVHETLGNLRESQTQLELGDPSAIPQFIYFETISGLYDDDGDISRMSSPAEFSSDGTPVDISDQIAQEIEIWESAYADIEAGEYGFLTTTPYTSLNDDGVITGQFTGEGESVAQASYMLNPELHPHPRYEFGDAFGPVVSNTFGGLLAISAALGTGGGLIGGASAAISHNRRKRELRR